MSLYADAYNASFF